MFGCWPLTCFWRGGHRRPCCRSSRSSRSSWECLTSWVGPCARGCFNIRTAFARHVVRHLPRGVHSSSRATRDRSSESDTESDDVRKRTGSNMVGEDVRPAMDSVYIDCDILLRSSLLPSRKHSREPLSTVDGSEGLPNSPQPFFQARHEATRRRVWLIVNLQHPENEHCGKLNRDVWRQPEFCDDILVSKAKLWQRDVSHFQAEQFIIYYFSGKTPSAEECPLVIIIDPRTGRAMRRWKAGSQDFPLDCEKASRSISAFLETHTLEGFSPPESPQLSPKASPEMLAAEDPEPPELCIEDFEEITITEAFMGDEVAKTDDGQSSICGPFWEIVETTSSGSASPAAPHCTKTRSAISLPVVPAA